MPAVLIMYACSDVSGENHAPYDDISVEEIYAVLEKDSLNVDALSRLWGIMIRKGEHQSVITSCHKYYEIAKETGNDRLLVYAGVNIGQSHFLSDHPDSMIHYFNEVLPYAEKIGESVPLTAIYNALAIHTLNLSLDYNESLSYFHKALEYSYEADDMLNYTVVLSNIVWVFYLRNDPTGLQYALNAYETGKSIKNDYAIYFGAVSCAYMYYVTGDYTAALGYVNEASYLAVKNPGQNGTDALKAMILSAMGRYSEASLSFENAFAHPERMDIMSTIEAYWSYGDFLYSRGRYNDAADSYLRGIELSEKNNNYFCILKLYRSLSDTYGRLGMPDKAIEYLHRSSDMTDTLFNVEKERGFNSIRLQYENAVRDNKIKDKEMQLMKSQGRNRLLTLLAAVLLIAVFTALILYRRQNRRYRELVIRYNEHRKREDNLRKENTMLRDVSEKKRSEERNEALYFQLEKIMERDRIYKDKDLSVEKLAELLDTNRSYISSMFSHMGTSFSNYVNSYRMREAARILSDPSDDTPLKVLSDDLGYSSISSFYRLFQQETGVPPARYRKEARRI